MKTSRAIHIAGLASQVAVRYARCPMCGSGRIRLGSEALHFKKGKTNLAILVRRWACPKCGEKFLTAASREKIDAMVVRKPNRRRVA